LKKILITIQGRTLILHYQIKHGLARKDAGLPAYIEVLPSAELARFDLKGLTPEMFCVNISDMVNIRGLFSGQVENERQIPVARWTLNHEEYLQALSAPAENLTHRQIVDFLAPLPGFTQESENQYIEFEESVVSHKNAEHATFSGYRLTIATEDIEGSISTYAYYSLDTRTPQGWQGTPPPSADYEAIRIALETKLQAIRDAGVKIAQVYDETDYAITRQDENSGQ
jgi:hypothetical protein